MTGQLEQVVLPGTDSEWGPLGEQDNYPTPPALARAGWAIARRYLLEADRLIPEKEPGITILPPWSVCEPGCGDDQPFLAAAEDDPRVVRLSGYDVRLVRPGPRFGCRSGHLQQVDWLASTIADDGPRHAIVTNPPFGVAEEFVRAALGRITPHGVVVMLFRLSFLGSLSRLSLWREHPPAEVSIIVPRPSFVGKGNDTNDYAFVVWAPWVTGQRITWCSWPKPKRKSTRK